MKYSLQESESLCCTENAIFPLRSIFPGAYAPVHKYSDRAKCATPQMLAVPSIQARTCRVLARYSSAWTPWPRWFTTSSITTAFNRMCHHKWAGRFFRTMPLPAYLTTIIKWVLRMHAIWQKH